MEMNAKHNGIGFAAWAALVAAGLMFASGPGFATEQAEQRREARDTRQDTGDQARNEAGLPRCRPEEQPGMPPGQA